MRRRIVLHNDRVLQIVWTAGETNNKDIAQLFVDTAYTPHEIRITWPGGSNKHISVQETVDALSQANNLALALRNGDITRDEAAGAVSHGPSSAPPVGAGA